MVDIYNMKLKNKDDTNCKPQMYYRKEGVAGEDFYDCVVSTYPKEWLITEITQDELLKYNFKEIRSFEPFWKLILGNKALLPLLWSMYPNHPNLLPAFYDRPD